MSNIVNYYNVKIDGIETSLLDLRMKYATKKLKGGLDTFLYNAFTDCLEYAVRFKRKTQDMQLLKIDLDKMFYHLSIIKQYCETKHIKLNTNHKHFLIERSRKVKENSRIGLHIAMYCCLFHDPLVERDWFEFIVKLCQLDYIGANEVLSVIKDKFVVGIV